MFPRQPHNFVEKERLNIRSSWECHFHGSLSYSIRCPFAILSCACFISAEHVLDFKTVICLQVVDTHMQHMAHTEDGSRLPNNAPAFSNDFGRYYSEAEGTALHGLSAKLSGPAWDCQQSSLGPGNVHHSQPEYTVSQPTAISGYFRPLDRAKRAGMRKSRKHVVVSKQLFMRTKSGRHRDA